MLFQPNITIWQELGYEQSKQNVNESFIDFTGIDTLNNSDNDEDEEYCETMVIKFKNLLGEVRFINLQI